MEQTLQRTQPLTDFAGGTEWIIDASGCAPDRLTSLSAIQRLCDRVVHDLTLTVVGQPLCHQFPSLGGDPSGLGGVTVLYLLSESHLACHTYPEHQFATFNLYCCRRRPAWPWREELRHCLDAQEVTVRELQRDLRTVKKESLR